MSNYNFFSELKRRNVYKVAVAYAVVAWLLIQAASIVLPTFKAPDWTMQVLLVALVIGFPIAVILAWAFEITPEGIKLERDVSPNESITAHTGRKLIGTTIVLAVVAAALLAWQLFGHLRPARSLEGGAPATPKEEALAGARPSIPEKSIAVLPFDNLSDDKSNAYFAEGVQDEILTRLAKVADLKVISRTSTQQFKSTPTNLPQIAKQLGVMNVLEGSVQKSNDQVRVNVQLINAMTDAHLWADMYDRKLTDIFAVESDIAKTIADTLQAKLTGSERTAIAKKPTTSPEAYELYLKGRFFWSKRTAANLKTSIDYFNQAIGTDPNYAPAYAGLAQAWMILPAYSGGAPLDCIPQAEAAAQKALLLDNTLAEAVATLASAKALFDFDLATARTEYERAIALNPNDSTTRQWFSTDVLASVGEHARELAEMQRAHELDPLSLIINNNLGSAYLHNGRPDEAIAQYRRASEIDRDFYLSPWNTAVALKVQGKLPEAIVQAEKAAAMTDDAGPLAFAGYLYGLVGRKDEAEKIMEKLRSLRAQRFMPAYNLAVVALGLGERAQAVHWLEESYRERDGNNIGQIRIDPVLAPLHGDPQFEALTDKVLKGQGLASVPAKK